MAHRFCAARHRGRAAASGGDMKMDRASRKQAFAPSQKGQG